MYELRRLKRYGFVSLGKFYNVNQAVGKLKQVTFPKYGDTTTMVYIGEDGYTYEIKYV